MSAAVIWRHRHYAPAANVNLADHADPAHSRYATTSSTPDLLQKHLPAGEEMLAKEFVVACGAIGSPTLLLRSMFALRHVDAHRSSSAPEVFSGFR